MSRAPVASRRIVGTLAVVLPATLLTAGLGAALVMQPPPARLLCLLGLVVIIAGLCAWLTRVVLEPVTLSESLNAVAGELERRLQELEAQRNQAQAILESMGEGVLALDAEGRILWLNGSAQRLVGAGAAQAAGKRLTELLRHPDVEGLLGETLAQRRPAVREIHAFAPEERAIRFQATPCAGGPGGTATVVVAQDVTEIRRLERMRREFVANVSHELKTPLTAIKSLLETLLSGALEDPANNRRFVTLIDEDATRLGRLIDDLLELSQIESKAAALQLQPVALQPLFEDLGHHLRPQLEARRVRLELALPPNTPAVQADPARLRQIFLNLLDNAIKFNAPGGRVSVRAAADGTTMRIAVEDTGIGIPEADLPRIFERFYRVDKARSRELGGTGLGLAIVKHLAELHAGRVTVESRPGQGSILTVILPLAA